MADLPARLYSPVELAHIVGLKQATIQNQCRSGQIEAKKIGLGWRITREEVLRYMDHGPRKVNKNANTDQSK